MFEGFKAKVHEVLETKKAKESMTFEQSLDSKYREMLAEEFKKTGIEVGDDIEVEVVVPEEYMGAIVGDLNSRRGRIISMEARGSSQVIRASVPLAQMFGYATEMRSMTQGRATYTMQFARYEEVPSAIAEEIMAKVAGKPAARAGSR